MDCNEGKGDESHRQEARLLMRNTAGEWCWERGPRSTTDQCAHAGYTEEEAAPGRQRRIAQPPRIDSRTPRCLVKETQCRIGRLEQLGTDLSYPRSRLKFCHQED